MSEKREDDPAGPGGDEQLQKENLDGEKHVRCVMWILKNGSAPLADVFLVMKAQTRREDRGPAQIADHAQAVCRIDYG